VQYRGIESGKPDSPRFGRNFPNTSLNRSNQLIFGMVTDSESETYCFRQTGETTFTGPRKKTERSLYQGNRLTGQ
jgi:hypothetical protein